ncbi:hypothetical protein K2173_018791 [Erythroxylum novogranatense]|uniref:Agenet domain-containing protein n=1 Tax=Erythroxylum novogranatense TaxID=1862640 RepID=A0AAV8T365_9ROSI|nr:hypothetical protein K2173_018791 [Erythroxylum novogranatense]
MYEEYGGATVLSPQHYAKFLHEAVDNLLMAAIATDATGIRPRKRLCRLKDDVFVDDKEPMKEVCMDTSNCNGSLRGVEPIASLAVDEWHERLMVRALITKKDKNKVKLQKERLMCPKSILASRIVVLDHFGVQVPGMNIIRPTCPLDMGKESGLIDIGTAVHVWWCDAWWEGIVVQKESEDKFLVYFPG